MREGFSTVIVSLYLLLASPFATASDFSDSEIDQICGICENCCSEGKVIKGSTKKANRKKSKKKAAAQESLSSKKIKEEWLQASLFGSNISASSLSPAEIHSYSDNQYKVVIKTEFSFDCKLRFDGNGQPSVLSNCKSSNEEKKWLVKEKKIHLNCIKTSTSDTCRGEYTLLPSGDKESGEVHKMTIAKKRV